MSATRRAGGGRKPIPTALRVLHGNPGKRPLNAAEAHAEPLLPAPPRQLSPAAKREWRRTGKALLDAGLITALDRALFAAYCQSYARWLELQELIARQGVLIENPDGTPRVNPLLRVAREAQEQYTRALVEFGMSPASRSRVKASPAGDPADPFEVWERGSSSAG